MKTGLIFGLMLAVLADFTLAHGAYTTHVLRFIVAIPQEMRGWSADLWGSS